MPPHSLPGPHPARRRLLRAARGVALALATGGLGGCDAARRQALQWAVDRQALFDKVASHRVPVIAVIHGPCLGGGLEFALACDYRLVVDGPGTQLGLPEIELGLLPAWGGTQRLPRVVGLERAFNVILGARRLNPRDAFRWGLADAVASGEMDVPSELDTLLERAAREGKRPKATLPRRTWRPELAG